MIDVWSAAPAEAAPYLAGVLARLAAPAGAAATGVTRLTAVTLPTGVTRPTAVTRPTGTEAHGDETVVLAGEGGVRGRVSREPDGLWLTVEGLPPGAEHTRPVIAVPGALDTENTAIAWAGDEPGLVAASEPVSGGSLRVHLGDEAEEREAGGREGTQEAAAPEKAGQEAAEPGAAAPPALFDQIYLLRPEGRGKKV